MRDRVLILAGLAVSVAIVTIPFWSARGGTKDLSKAPDLVMPVNARRCVAPADVMRSQHMQMLVNWREDVVRHGDRRYIAFDGKVYEKSLTHTCLGCHNKEQFCNRCHTYAGVSGPYCWNCHNEPQTNIARSTP